MRILTKAEFESGGMAHMQRGDLGMLEATIEALASALKLADGMVKEASLPVWKEYADKTQEARDGGWL